jgi:hypothetical protein
MSFLQDLGKIGGALLGAVLHPGQLAEDLAGSLGLPAPVGKLVAVGADLLTHNYAAAAGDGIGLFLEPGQGQTHDASSKAKALINDLLRGPVGGQAALLAVPPGPGLPAPGPASPPGAADSGSPAGQGAASAFFALSDEELLKAVEENRIPREVLQDQGSLIALQQRLYRYNESVTLLTDMLRATHEMRMEIIRQVRA